jgi:hypothetical protein
MAKKPAASKSARWLVAAMLLVSGLPAFWFTKFLVRDSYQLYRAQGWPEVAATVKVSLSDTLPENEGEGHGPSALYERIEYAFQFNGKDYVSRRVAPFERWNSGKHTEKYPEGISVVAWVNPQNPYESVLDRERRFGFYAVLTLTLLFDAWLVFALLTALVHERYLKAFLGHFLTVLPAGIGVAAIVADEVERTKDWYFVVSGFLGTIMTMGLSVTLSVWFKRAAIVGLIGFAVGVLCIIAGVVMRE